MSGGSNDRLINKICIKVFLFRIITCQPEIRILLLLKSGQLQTNTLIFFIREYITHLSKSFITFCVYTQSVMINRKLIFRRIILYFSTRPGIIQKLYTKLCHEAFIILVFPAIDRTE